MSAIRLATWTMATSFQPDCVFDTKMALTYGR